MAGVVSSILTGSMASASQPVQLMLEPPRGIHVERRGGGGERRPPRWSQAGAHTSRAVVLATTSPMRRSSDREGARASVTKQRRLWRCPS